ncbi:919_t:CDS:2, partial [Diversispora eburnea]
MTQLPIDVEFNDKENHSVLTYEEALERRISSLIGTFTDALIISSRNVTSAQELQKERQKHLTKAHEYHENDIILLYDSAKRQVHGQKFNPKWTGPFWIEKKLGNKVYLIRDKIGNTLPNPVHAERLKHYKQRHLVEPFLKILQIMELQLSETQRARLLELYQ